MIPLNVGLGNYVASEHIIAIINPESAPVKRMISDAKDKGTAVDATFGRRTRSVIVMDSGQLVLSPIQPSTIVSKAKATELE